MQLILDFVSELRRDVSDDEAAMYKEMEKIAFTSEEGCGHIVYGAIKSLGSREEEDKL